MKLVEFINKYIKTKVDYDKNFGPQCVDLFRQYCQDVLNIPHTGSVEGAKDLYYNYFKLPKEQEYFDRLAKLIKPRYGDVVIFNETKTNKYGHVAIVINLIDENNILVFEQDGFKQDGAKLTVKPTENIAGYLRFIK